MASASNNFSHNHHRLSLRSQTPNLTNSNSNPSYCPNSDTGVKNPIGCLPRGDSLDMAEPNNFNNNNACSSSAAATATEMAIDGSDSDSDLSGSKLLTRAEVLKRRSRRLKQLSKIYRDHYWSLIEELRVKYKEYYWDYGKSSFQDDEDNRDDLNRGNNSVLGSAAGDIRNCNGKLGLGLGANGNVNRCEMHGCKTKAMALTRFCHAHILSDTNQKLYRGCTYANKSSAMGATRCMKPILRSAVPSLCVLHLQKAEKHVTRALRKAGLNITSTSNIAPKFHVVVAEYVRQIQTKRRAALKLLDKVGSKEENTACKALDTKAKIVLGSVELKDKLIE